MFEKLISDSRTDLRVIDVVLHNEDTEIKTSTATLTAIIGDNGTENLQDDCLVDKTLSHKYYNLFIVENVDFDSSIKFFVISKDRVLQNKSGDSFNIFLIMK